MVLYDQAKSGEPPNVRIELWLVICMPKGEREGGEVEAGSACEGMITTVAACWVAKRTPTNDPRF